MNEINTLSDAIQHWRSFAGGRVKAGNELINSIKNNDELKNYVDELTEKVKNLLLIASLTEREGEYCSSSNPGYRGMNCYPLGSFKMDIINYSVKWTATDCNNQKREVIGTLIVTFIFDDNWDFEKNPQYGAWKNFYRENLPSIYAGCGAAFSIYGTIKNETKISITQVCQ